MMVSGTTSRGRTQAHEQGSNSPRLRLVSGRPVRVAVVGCGAVAQQLHLPVLAGHEGVQLAALVDADLGRVQRLARGYGVTTIAQDAGALMPDAVDAVVLATPPAHHAPATLELVRRGLHVFVEKPMATCSADAAAMVQAAAEAGVVLCVGYFRRLLPSIRLLRALIDAQWLGRPVGFEATAGGFYNWGAATLGNMRKELAGGGVLMDFGSHILDLLHFLLDGPAEVLSYLDNARGGIEADCEMHLRLSAGGRPLEGRVALGRTRCLESAVRIHCERGTLEFQISERYRIRVLVPETTLEDAHTRKTRQLRLQAEWADEPETPWFEVARIQIDDWLEAIRTGRPPSLSAESALATAHVIDECYRRAERLPETWCEEGLQPTPGGAQPAAPARPRRVLLTGATGFIGGRLAEVLALRDGWQVRALVHNPANASRLARLPVEMVQADLLDPVEVERLMQGCDAVVHCAVGTSWGEPHKIPRVTVGGTCHLAAAALRAGVGRFVHFSTMAVHGDMDELTGMLDETSPVRPPRGSVYATSKAQAERVIAGFAARGLSAVVLRPARVFGPFSHTFVVNPVRAMAEGRFRWLNCPDVPCDMVYVDNLVEATVRALAAADDKIKGEVFAISDGDPMSWREFYEYFARVVGVEPSSFVSDPRPSRCPARPWRRALAWPAACLGGIKTLATSREFKAFGGLMLATDPVGWLPRHAMRRFPALETLARRLVGADDTPPIYRREQPAPAGVVRMGSGGALLSIEKARMQLGYIPVVPRARALELTAEWIRHAGLIES